MRHATIAILLLGLAVLACSSDRPAPCVGETEVIITHVNPSMWSRFMSGTTTVSLDGRPYFLAGTLGARGDTLIVDCTRLHSQ